MERICKLGLEEANVMYRSSKKIESKGLAVLRKDLDIYLRGHEFVYAKSLKRKVFLSKCPMPF